MQRGGYIFSAVLNLSILLAIVFGLPQIFQRKLPEETPIVVELVNVAPETRATQVNKTPPRPNKPDKVAENEPPPKPEPPKPPPPPPPPPPPAEKPPEPKPPPPKAEAPKPPPPKPELAKQKQKQKQDD